jgi:HPt (histidine-containing phosphotransfer) domain-containing protein
MGKNVFQVSNLDSAFLDAVYENDKETALVIFQQYLQDLPSDLHAIHHSFESGDREQFRGVIHKKKVAFSYVGLTDVTADLNELEKKCALQGDLNEYRNELASVMNRINSSTEAVRKVLEGLEQQEL